MFFSGQYLRSRRSRRGHALGGSALRFERLEPRQVFAGVSVTPVAGTQTTEAGGQATFNVVLTSAPLLPVTINLSSSDTTEGTVGTTTLTFTVLDWNVPQQVTVTGVNDAIDDGNIGYTLVVDLDTLDLFYLGLNPADVSLTNVDNDTAGLSVSPTSGLTVTEAGGQASFNVHLNSQPLGDVTVHLSSTDLTEGTVSTSTLTFTAANWQTDQTVTITGVNDAIDDGNVPFFVTVIASSADSLYNGMSGGSVSLTNTDNDTAGISVSPTSGLTITEAGGQATISVHLNSQPLGDVTIQIVSNDVTEGTVSPSTLTFTSANWQTDQTVTVTGVNDLIDDGDVGFTVSVSVASVADSTYNGMSGGSVSLTNTDNDTAGISVSPTSGLEVSELGGQATFSVHLNSQPLGDVTIQIVSNDLTEGTVSVSTLTFTAANWQTDQTVTVTGVNDLIDDGDVGFTVSVSATSTLDGLYDGFDAGALSFTNTDNDTAGITVTPTSGLVITEAGGQATFTVRLDSQPLGSVTVQLQVSDASEGNLSTTTLTFDATNWGTPQTVTITGENDNIDDGDQDITATVSATSTADGNYDGMNGSDVSITTTDDDTAGLTVTALGGTTITEAGSQTSYSFVLDSQPTGTVTIQLDLSDSTEASLSTATLTFDSSNWSTPQIVTITGSDDEIDDGDVDFEVSITISSSDAPYEALTPSELELTTTDDDTAGITVTPTSGLVVTEAGGQATFTVRLDSQPLGIVTVNLAVSDAGEGSLSTTTLTFNESNWNTPQTVTVTGEDDALDDGNASFSVTVVATSGADALYDGLAGADVSMTNADDDGVGITVTPTSGLVVTEAGGQATFTVVLDTQPTGDVTVHLDSSDTGEASLSAATLHFDASNWDTPQTVTITGVDDALDDGDITATVSISATSAADSQYDGLTALDVSLTNSDDDAADITVDSPSETFVTEAGGQSTFTVVLDSQPLGTVIVHLNLSDTSEAELSAGTLTFDATNWNTPQTVTVTGLDDDIDDGDQAFEVTVTATSSADGNYDGLAGSEVALTSSDDDAAGITVTPTSGLVVTEAGGQATFTVVLDSQPLGTVIVYLDLDDASEAELSSATLTFDATNWNTPQTVTVTGSDDDIDDGDRSLNVTISAASAVDGNYDGQSGPPVALVVGDDDAAGVTVVSLGAATVAETGSQTSYSFVLDSQPTGTVTVQLDLGDTSEASLSTATLVFDAGNWDTPQIITLTGVDDSIDDGDTDFDVTVTVTSGDSHYDGLPIGTLSLTTTDDDVAGITVTPTSGLVVTEAGGQATFTIVLESQPLGVVTVHLALSHANEASLSTDTLTFDATNWNTPQSVTVTGADDELDDGDADFTVSVSATSVADGNYGGLAGTDIAVSNLDDDDSPADPTIFAPRGSNEGTPGTFAFDWNAELDFFGDVSDSLAFEDLAASLASIQASTAALVEQLAVIETIVDEAKSAAAVKKALGKLLGFPLPQLSTQAIRPASTDQAALDSPPAVKRPLGTTNEAVGVETGQEEFMLEDSGGAAAVARGGEIRIDTPQLFAALDKIELKSTTPQKEAEPEPDAVQIDSVHLTYGTISLGLIGWTVRSAWTVAATAAAGSTWRALDPLLLLNTSGASDGEDLRSLASKATKPSAKGDASRKGRQP